MENSTRDGLLGLLLSVGSPPESTGQMVMLSVAHVRHGAALLII